MHSTICWLNQGYCTSKLTLLMSLKAFHRFYMQVICMHAYVYNTVTQELVCVYVHVRIGHACSTHTLVNDMKFYQYKFIVVSVLIVSEINFF